MRLKYRTTFQRELVPRRGGSRRFLDGDEGNLSVTTGKKLYKQQPYPEPRSGRRALSYGDS